MAEGVFSALVEGYTKGKELQMKKAKETADKVYREQERQFKLQQAQAAAKQQEIQNQFEARRVAAEEQAQKRLADDLERKKKADEANAEFRKQSLDLRRQLAESGTDFKKWQTVWNTFTKERDNAIYKGDLSPLEADNLTKWMMSAQDEAIVGPQSGQPMPGGPMPGAGGQQQGVNPQILQALHGMSQMTGNQPPPVQQGPGALTQQLGQSLFGGHMPGRYAVKPPNEFPEVAGSMLPGQRIDMELKEARRKYAEASAKTQDAVRQVNLAMKQSIVDVNKQRVEMLKSQRKRFDLMTPGELKKQGETINHMINEDRNLQSQITKRDADRTRDQLEIDAERAITGGAAVDEGFKKQVRAQNEKDAHDVKVYNDSVAHVLLSMEAAKAILANPESSQTDKAVAQGILSTNKVVLETDQALLVEARKRLADSDVWVKNLRTKTVTSGSGGADHKANNADTAAREKAAREAAARQRALQQLRNKEKKFGPVPFDPATMAGVQPLRPGTDPIHHGDSTTTQSAPKRKLENRKKVEGKTKSGRKFTVEQLN